MKPHSQNRLACVINSINRSHIKMGDDVVVIGGGVMGLLHVCVRSDREHALS